MITRDEWQNLLAAAMARTEADIARDIARAVNTVFIKRGLDAPGADFVPAEPPFRFTATRWYELLKDVAAVLRKLYGTRVFMPTLKLAEDTRGRPLYATMTLVAKGVPITTTLPLVTNPRLLSVCR